MSDTESILNPGENMRVINMAKPPTPVAGWVYSGEQTSPEFYEVNGIRIPLLSDKVIHEATRDLFVDIIEANIELFVGATKTQHLPGVKATIEPSPLLKKISVTEEAYEKTISYAQLIGSLYSPIPEVAMHMLRHQEAPKGMITDVVACQGQEVTSSSCRFSDYVGFQYNYEDKYYAGWCHSHGTMKTFHSSTDNRNVIRSVRTGGIREKFSLDGFSVSVSYLPSMVVNAVGDKPFGIIGVGYWSSRDNDMHSFLKEVPIELEKNTFNIVKDEEILTNQLLEYVTVH